MAALLLARIHERPSHLASAVELAVAGLQGVLAATAAAAGPAALAAGADERCVAVDDGIVRPGRGEMAWV